MPMTARATQGHAYPDKEEAPDAARARARATLAETLGQPGVLSSPAGRLQAALGAEYAEAYDEDRWPLRWTVAMVFSTCGAFWTAVYFLVAALIG